VILTIFSSAYSRTLTATNDPDLGLGPVKGEGYLVVGSWQLSVAIRYLVLGSCRGLVTLE